MSLALKRFWIQLTVDPRKFGALVAVLVIAVLMWARMIVISKPPRRAVADNIAQSVTGSDEIKNKSNIVGGGLSDKSSTVIIEVELASMLKRDPFRISRKHFPKSTSEQNPDEERTKLVSKTAEDDLHVETQRTAHIQRLVEGITLGATMPKGELAVIDGITRKLGKKFTIKGDEEAQFTLLEINARWVLIDCEGLRFELHMPDPHDNKDK